MLCGRMTRIIRRQIATVTPATLTTTADRCLKQAPTVYIIWYGNWSAKDKNIIDYYFQHLGGSTQEKINTTYSDSTGKFVPNAVNHSPPMIIRIIIRSGRLSAATARFRLS